MESRSVVDSGLSVSAIGLGCNNFGMLIDEDRSKTVVRAALDNGITFFDTAAMYGGSLSEVYLGRALGAQRASAVVATKFGANPRGGGPAPGGGTRQNVRSECEASLRRLGTDYIDLYYQHYPDPGTPVEETLEALDGLVRDGKVRHAACSNFTAEQVGASQQAAERQGTVRFIANQIEWNLLNRAVEADVVPASISNQVGVVPYFPLASGLLTGKYPRTGEFAEGTRFAAMPVFTQGLTEATYDTVDRLAALADKLGHSLLELSVGWLLAQPGVSSVLVGATRSEQVAQNAAAADWHLSEADGTAVEEALAG